MSASKQQSSSSTQESPSAPRGGLEAMTRFGDPLEMSLVEAGLRKLNPDVSLDAPVRRPSEYRFAMNPVEELKPLQKKSSGVYFRGRFVCAIDRGTITEFGLRKMVKGFLPIPMVDIEKYDDSKVFWVEILATDPIYRTCKEKAEKNDDNYTISGDKVFRYDAVRWTDVPGPIEQVGWRHTFEALIAAGIPGITRESLAEQFNVDMSRRAVEV